MLRIHEPDEHRATRRAIERKVSDIERGGRRGVKPGAEYDLLGTLLGIADRGTRGPTSDAQQRVYDVSRATTALYGAGNGHLRLPLDWLCRDLLAGTADAGGYTVGTGARPPDSEIVEALRAISLAADLGVQIWPSVTGWGPLTLPRVTTNAAATWVAENAAPSAATVVFDAGVSFTPSTLSVNVGFSRRLRLQSSAQVDAFVRRHLTAAVWAELDRAFLAGNGTGAEPLGILNSTGVTVEALGTHGAAPALANLASMEKAVGEANGRDIAFVASPALRSKLRRTGDTFGNPLWTENDRAAGMRGYVSGAMPSNLTKGTGTALSAAIAGDWSQALIAMFGAVDLLVDVATFSTKGAIRVVVTADAAWAPLNPAAFAVCRDAVTT